MADSAAYPLTSVGARARAVEVERTAAVPWYIWCCLLANVSSAIGGEWDIAWHKSIGRDSFWTSAHVLIYLCGVLAGLGQTRRDFAAQVVHTAVVLVACIPMTWAWGVRGIILGSIVASGSYVITAALLLRGAMRETGTILTLPTPHRLVA